MSAKFIKKKPTTNPSRKSLVVRPSDSRVGIPNTCRDDLLLHNAQACAMLRLKGIATLVARQPSRLVQLLHRPQMTRLLCSGIGHERVPHHTHGARQRNRPGGLRFLVLNQAAVIGCDE